MHDVGFDHLSGYQTFWRMAGEGKWNRGRGGDWEKNILEEGAEVEKMKGKGIAPRTDQTYHHLQIIRPHIIV